MPEDHQVCLGMIVLKVSNFPWMKPEVILTRHNNPCCDQAQIFLQLLQSEEAWHFLKNLFHMTNHLV